MNRIFISSIAGALLAATAAVPAFADTSSASGAADATGRVMPHPAQTGPVSIDQRISMLESLLSRIQSSNMNSSASAKITTAIQAQIDKLTALKASGQTTLTPGTAAGAAIGTNTQGKSSGPDASTRVSLSSYLTLASKAAITAAANHLLEVADQLSSLAAKLDSRLSDATSVDTASLRATLSDMNAKIADAKTQANAALTLVAGLSDDSDASTDTSARDTLQKAAADIKTARTDITAAYKDAMTIITAIRGKGPGATTGTPTTANVNANANAQ